LQEWAPDRRIERMKKLRVGILFGGRSGEHEVSLLSAASVLEAIDKSKYEVVPIGITKEGRWVTALHAENLLRGKSSEENVRASHLRAGDPQATTTAAVLAAGDGIIVPPMPAAESLVPFESTAPAPPGAEAVQVDIIFPVLHGTFGEDGTIQGLLELADIAYVGAGVLGSAAGMDKDVMKRLFADAGRADRHRRSDGRSLRPQADVQTRGVHFRRRVLHRLHQVVHRRLGGGCLGHGVLPSVTCDSAA